MNIINKTGILVYGFEQVGMFWKIGRFLDGELKAPKTNQFVNQL